jgi:phospholipase C
VRRAGCLLVIALLLVSGSVAAANTLSKPPPKPLTQLQLFLEHIKHVVVVVMENHAFDSIFGSYCPTVSAYCPTAVAGTPAGTCVPTNPNGSDAGAPYRAAPRPIVGPNTTNGSSNSTNSSSNGTSGSGNTTGGSGNTTGGSGNSSGGSGNGTGGSGNSSSGSGNGTGGSGNSGGGSGNGTGGSGNSSGGSGNGTHGSGNSTGGSGNGTGGSGNSSGGSGNGTKGSGECIKQFPFTNWDYSPGEALPHTRNSSLAAWNHGAMNGFYEAENSGDTPFGYYNGNTTPLMWDFAEEYGLADDYFSSYLSYSLATHWSYVSGGNGPVVTQTYGLGDKTGGFAPTGVRSTYLQEAQNVTSVEDLLNRSHTSWKYYEFPLGHWSKESNTSLIGGPGTENAFNYWNPQAAKKESYGPGLTTHFVANQNFFSQAEKGTLPQLSWVIPYYRYSQHPAANMTLGDGWLASLVDAVEASPTWNSTALFLTYDEYGGFYDNVAPPVVNGTQLGFRLPLIVISPFTHPGTVVSSLLDPWSVLQSFEQVGHLGCMSPLDCSAPSVLPFFNFSSGPRAPMLFPLNDTLASYPMVVQPASAPWTKLADWQAPEYILDGTGENSGFVD